LFKAEAKTEVKGRTIIIIIIIILIYTPGSKGSRGLKNKS